MPAENQGIHGWMRIRRRRRCRGTTGAPARGRSEDGAGRTEQCVARREAGREGAGATRPCPVLHLSWGPAVQRGYVRGSERSAV
jgi:hypothetical protein